jgi:hypothetical protein
VTLTDHAVQAWILIFSGGSAYLVSRTDKWHRWGHVAGLISQPAYFLTTIASGQWAMFALTGWFVWSWSKGIYNRFWREECKSA